MVFETPEADSLQKFMQQPYNQEVYKKIQDTKRETTVMVVCSD